MLVNIFDFFPLKLSTSAVRKKPKGKLQIFSFVSFVLLFFDLLWQT